VPYSHSSGHARAPAPPTCGRPSFDGNTSPSLPSKSMRRRTRITKLAKVQVLALQSVVPSSGLQQGVSSAMNCFPLYNVKGCGCPLHVRGKPVKVGSLVNFSTGSKEARSSELGTSRRSEDACAARSSDQAARFGSTLVESSSTLVKAGKGKTGVTGPAAMCQAR
jgi:hypothetical protein